MKTKNKLKIYYIVVWNRDCWDSHMQHQIRIEECYKLKTGFIKIYDYHEDITHMYYGYAPRGEFCFKWNNKTDIFSDLEKAQRYAIKKIDEMYLSRCDYLIKERDEAIKKINGEDNEE